MFVFNMGYFFRIWAKTRQTFSKFTDDVIFFQQCLNVRRVLAQIQEQNANYIK